MRTKKIGWQKYEDVIRSHLDSSLMKDFFGFSDDNDDEDDYGMDSNSSQENFDSYEDKKPKFIINPTKEILDEISTINSFDCWMAHTNFNVTKSIKDKLDTIEGVEILKVCSRYRFFIGVGKMFDFQEIKQRIEDKIIHE